jgi:polysaccharide deacetylase family protein (PEP-CTERM system associated)
MKNIFTVDVEDWYHILDLKSTPEFSRWDALPSIVEKNFYNLLDLFSEKDVKTTCFFLGWIAEKYPHLVKEAVMRGHEVASHGYKHKLVYKMTPEEFYFDAKRSKEAIEDITGKKVSGFRAPGFSTTEETPWFFDLLIKAGYTYDSSLFPIPRLHGGMKSNNLAPFKVTEDFYEFPITLIKLLNSYHCFFGGGYLRHNFYFTIKHMTKKVLNEGRPVIFYIHPREIDSNHPRLPMNAIRYIKSYGYLHTTKSKLRSIFNDFEITTVENFINNYPMAIAPAQKSTLIELNKFANSATLKKVPTHL